MMRQRAKRPARGQSRPQPPKPTTGRFPIALPQLRQRAVARLRALSGLTAELQAQCEAAIAECRRLQAEAASWEASQEANRSTKGRALAGPGSPSAPNPRGTCRHCSVRDDLDRLRAFNARLRTNAAELLDFLEEISGLLAPPAETGQES